MLHEVAGRAFGIERHVDYDLPQEFPLAIKNLNAAVPSATVHVPAAETARLCGVVELVQASSPGSPRALTELPFLSTFTIRELGLYGPRIARCQSCRPHPRPCR